ncbi:hypothetical protein LX81_01715 [Palleronia aestuarii]|uniref:Uncharacterized protein n=1 Tax=Palleronia aestuarii TaxID=568105 RepID=A0A2W7NK57_9RHOB|nr:hypothetical protein [Palleronia aestuarii]PZX17084.1 hypothetical protein LX81_01715 [Palleronia aestuarii]
MIDVILIAARASVRFISATRVLNDPDMVLAAANELDYVTKARGTA